MNNFICPVNKARLTSPFGRRVIAGKVEGHQGVDLAGPLPGQKVAIYAAADGIVKACGPLSTYGNRVLLTHRINGKLYETNYAHLDSWDVKHGQSVKQGDKIGVMGQTGRSFGVHLHFEIHDGPYKPGQPNAVDPMKYIKLSYTESNLTEKNTLVEDDETMKFTNDTPKKAVRDHIKQMVDNKYIGSEWLDKFDKGTITNGDYEGLSLIAQQKKAAKK